MSFSYDVKEDILKNDLDAALHIIELEAFLRYSSEILISGSLKLAFSSGNLHIIRHYISLVKGLYSNVDYQITSKVLQKLKHQTIYTCLIEQGARNIIEDLELLENGNLKKEEILLDSNHIIAYLRGAFLAKGSVNDPKTSQYHLEISTDKETEALFLQRCLNYYELNARIAKRRNNLIVYIKEKDLIIELLRRIGANVSMNEFENIVIKRELSANINRLLNIDVANQQKTNKSAKEQLKYIKYLEYNYPLEKLDPKLLLVMKVRIDYPEASLSELISIINDNYDEKITKSGLNHRLRKIKEIAIDFESKKK